MDIKALGGKQIRFTCRLLSLAIGARDSQDSVHGNRYLKISFATLRITGAVGLLAMAGYFAADHFLIKPVLAQSCDNARQTSITLKPLATGQLKKFKLIEQPVDVASITFKNGDGANISIADFTGRTVLLNIWATWCVPCKKEMPALDSLQSQLGSDDFEVVPVSVDRGEGTRPRAFYKDNNLDNLALYSDSSTEIFNTLQKMGLVFGLPNSILIDKNGCALGILLGEAEWGSQDASNLIKAAM